MVMDRTEKQYEFVYGFEIHLFADLMHLQIIFCYNVTKTSRHYLRSHCRDNPGKVRITSVISSKYFKADINLVIVEY